MCTAIKHYILFSAVTDYVSQIKVWNIVSSAACFKNQRPFTGNPTNDITSVIQTICSTALGTKVCCNTIGLSTKSHIP